MKRILSILIALAMLIGAAPLAVFAGGGNDFPEEGCINSEPLRPESSFTFNFTGEGVYIDFYSGAEGVYVFESSSDLDLFVRVYDGEGNEIAYNDDGDNTQDFKCYCPVGYRTDVYLYIGEWGSETGSVTVTATYSDVESVTLKQYPTKTTYLPTDWSPDITGAVFEISYKNGDKATWIPASGGYTEVGSPDGVNCSRDFVNELQPGYANQVRLSCYGYEFYYDISVRDYYFDEARVTRMPYRSEYIVGVDNHSFYPDGMLVQLYKNGSPVETVNFSGESPTHPLIQEFALPDEYVLGENEISVRFANGVSAELTVTGIENPYESIEMVKLPDKTVYDTTPNGFFPNPELAGGVLRVHYKNGEYYDHTFDDGYDNQILGHYYYYSFTDWQLKVGANTIGIDFCGLTCTFDVTGVESTIKSVELLKQPDRLNYYIGETDLSIKGARLRVNYTDNTYKIINFTDENRYIDGFYVDYALESAPVAGGNVATLWYGGCSAEVTVTFRENDVKRVTVAKDPDKTVFGLHSVVLPEDLAGLVLNVTYQDGTRETWDYSANNGVFRGAEVFGSAYIDNYGYNALTLNMAGYYANVYVLSKDLFVMSYEVVRGPDANGSNAVIRFSLEDGASFEATFPGNYNSDDYATGFLNLPGYGRYSYDLYRNANIGGDKYVVLYVFEMENPILMPMGGSAAQKGDFDGDGEISVADALAALRIAAKLAPETASSVEIGDVDGDGHVTVSDALAILRVAAKLADPSSLG